MNYKYFMELRKANEERIEEHKAAIDLLEFRKERDAAFEKNDFAAAKEYIKKAHENDARIADLNDSINHLKIENKVLTENANYYICKQGLQAIREAFKKYSGKKYGEKTKEKIFEEVKKAGFYFYFSDRYSASKSNMTIEPADPDFRYFYELRSAVYTPCGKPFINENNTITFEESEPQSNYRFIDNTTYRATQIIEAYQAHKAATEAAKVTESKLYSILPTGSNYTTNIGSIDNIF